MKVTLLLDSISPDGIRLTTFEVIHSGYLSYELRKHRDLSVTEQKLNIKDLVNSKLKVNRISDLVKVNKLTKELINLILISYSPADEYSLVINCVRPFVNMTSIVTATNFDNFIEKRVNGDDEELKEIAITIKDFLENRKPALREYHVPMNVSIYFHGHSENEILQIRSYLLYDPSAKDFNTFGILNLSEDLIKENKLSCFEHVAKPMSPRLLSMSNFKGWRQLRKMLPQDRLH